MKSSKNQIGMLLIGILLLLFTIHNFGNIDYSTFNFNDYTFDSPTANDSPQTYSGNGVSFNYPYSWQVEESDDNGTIITVRDGNYNEFPMFEVYMKPDDGLSYQDSVSLLRESPNDGWKKIGNNTITINNKTAYEDIFKINDPSQFNETLKMKQIIMADNGKIYTLMFFAKENDFDNEKQNFDLILNSFKID